MKRRSLPQFNVLVPVFEPSGEYFTAINLQDGTPLKRQFWRVAEWAHVGTASSVADAKAKFGGSPVLEAVHA